MKELNPEQLALLKAEYQQLEQYYKTLVNGKRTSESALVNKKNRACPACNETNIVNKVRRVQGGLEGSLEGDFSSSSFFGTGSGNGSIRGNISGKLDTNEVLYCKDCGNEWKRAEMEEDYRTAALSDMFNSFQLYFLEKEEAEEATFDPDDLSERFSSLDEKKADIIKKAQKLLQKPSVLRDYHAETVMQFLQNHAQDLDYMERLAEWPESRFEEWGCKALVAVEETAAEPEKGFFARLAGALSGR